ncbi:MAG: hypothetical protein MJ223_03000 [Mycoplasmoidaceae bacterium]|nr:hypothetical protein [Mycoplasmoidaceae bacterium]
MKKIKNNYSSLYKNFSSVISYKNNLSLFKSALKSFVEVCLIGFMSYLIIKTNTLSLGRLTFLISAFGLFKNSVDGLTVYPLEKLEFDIY